MSSGTPGNFKALSEVLKDTRQQISGMRKAVELMSRATGDPLWASMQGGALGTMGPALKDIKETLEKAEGAAFRFSSISSDADDLLGGGKR